MGKGKIMKREIVVYGIILLLLIVNVSGSIVRESKYVSTVGFDGNILYVGGSGSNNYTRIQDAIEAANSGDTVFVYDDSSPYYESITIDKSIHLIGEDKETTTIRDKNVPDIITLNSNSCSVCGFTIQGEKMNISSHGITINSNGNYISDNIFQNYFSNAIRLHHAQNNLIENNFFDNNFNIGIYLGYSNFNTIKNNIITNVFDGIHVYYDSHDNIITLNEIYNTGNGIAFWCNTQHNNVSYNIFDNNRWICIEFHDTASYNTVFKNIFRNSDGIEFCCNTHNNYVLFNIFESNGYNCMEIHQLTRDNIVSRNTFRNGARGVIIAGKAKNNMIVQNNFEQNTISSLYLLLIDNTNVWESNYWDRPRVLPKFVLGYALYPPHFAFDWHPASEPYDIDI